MNYQDNNKNYRSDAWAIVALGLSLNYLFTIVDSGSYFIDLIDMNIISFIAGLISFLITPIVFGVIGIKSKAKKIALASIFVSFFNILLLIIFFIEAINSIHIGG